MTPNDPTAQGLATMASAGFEFGGDAEQVAHDVRTMWEQLGRPVGAFDAAARAIAALPQRPEVPVADQARRREFERAVGINPVEVELAAALSARELLERMARTCGASC
ncbi:hypothetical protein GCM10017714_23930 [Curtobacterium pusillum]|uniref:Uncharacterized protein n=1 Tax=Curtobacterium pusillum TaxID=69373 RepID=A0AAW3T3B9_9MICO|nr:hypothetical protein [Curtobacterium pusillum]MBA8989544.1 hypothetical protein [Curtobacterium pusillum]NUU14962.1 hypothetical protein [Curtobacterium pusillum]GLK32525.1 hypothetical protein GCM10017610_28100 [Curtobacterium pusillum]